MPGPEPLPGRAGLAELVQAIAARSPAPGGGAAAAAAAALGCAAGAMAAHYSTGAKHGERAGANAVLAARLTAAAYELLAHADADAEAFARLDAAKKESPAAYAAAAAAAAAIPAAVLAGCARHGEAAAGFLPDCNPRLASDVAVAVHLLAGAGRAAWATLRENRPGEAVRAAAAEDLRRLDAAEAALAALWPAGPGRAP
jgi:formiminotetrahydrofolate cyclodeaminase